MGTLALLLVTVLIFGSLALLRHRESEAVSRAEKEAREFPPVPRWRPDVPLDRGEHIAIFASYCERSRKFAVFEHGTVAVVPRGSEDPERDARTMLERVYNAHPDFNPRMMNDGNWLVAYSQPVYSVVLAREVEEHGHYLEANHLDGLVRAEVLMNAQGQANVFDKAGHVGLFGRARMFMDAQSPRVVEVVDGRAGGQASQDQL